MPKIWKRLLIPVILVWMNEYSFAEPKARIIPEELGIKIVEELRESLEKEDTTSLRSEIKSVISQPAYQVITERIKQGMSDPQDPKKFIPIEFATRDRQPLNAHNETFTFYGRGLSFQNQGLKTSIKLRARFYLEVSDLTSNPPEVKRSAFVKDSAFLEIKIKNPSPDMENVVHKYRLKIADADLIALYKLNPRSPDFFDKLETIREHVIALPENQAFESQTNSMFMVISQLAQIEPDFIKPMLGISYKRVSMLYVEKAYTTASGEDLGDWEYQFTADQDIRGYKPQLMLCKGFSFLEYFQNTREEDLIYTYPSEAVVIEAKVPLRLDRLKPSQRSHIHRFLQEEYITPITSQDHVLENFRAQRGKAHQILAAYYDNRHH